IQRLVLVNHLENPEHFYAMEVDVDKKEMKMYDSLNRESTVRGVEPRMRCFIKGVNDQKLAKLRETNAKCPKQE
ncbi:unnamed protein product, partial [Ectocarpus sp. 12 AP-2014]